MPVQGLVLTPVEVARLEPLAPPPVQHLLAWAMHQPPAVVMGSSLKSLVGFLSFACTLQTEQTAAITMPLAQC